MFVSLEKDWLQVKFPAPQRCLSWALLGGGSKITENVVWHQVRNEDLPAGLNPREFLNARLVEKKISGAAVMMTSADLSDYQDEIRQSGNRANLWIRCIATVGMDNALRAGDPAVPWRAGTINLLCAVSEPLSESAMIEMLSIAVEARTAAVMDAALASIQTGARATGTGTDCVTVVCPIEAEMKIPVTYAGKHTEIGSLAGNAVYAAVETGLKIWKQNFLKETVYDRTK